MGDIDEPRQPPAVRIADADRDRVIAVLQTAAGEGRITLDEFAERAGVVYAASTSTELDAVLSDLPATSASTTNPSTRRPRRWVIAVMGAARRRGRWSVAPQTTAVAFWGAIKIDFRGAVVETPVIDLSLWAIMGGIDVTVPDGIPVDVSGVVLMGGKSNRVKDVPVVPGAPLIRIKVRGVWGGVSVRSRPMDDRGRLRRPSSRSVPEPAPALPRPVYAERPPDPEISSLLSDVSDGIPEPASDGTVTILFTDIEGSTELATLLGDHRWLDVLREHNKLVREQIAIAGGREIKAQGDGFMITFPGVGRALRCAAEIQRALSTWRETHPDAPIYVRIGIHTGEVLADGGDIYGKHVMIAARVASQARGSEILATSLVRELADGAGIQFGAGRDVELRGLDRPWRLYPVDWSPD